MKFQNCTSGVLALLLTTGFAVGLPLFFGPKIQAQTYRQPPAKDQDLAKARQGDRAKPAMLIVMAPRGPVFARLDITVDRQPYRTWVTSLLTSRLDVNRDSRLTIDELQLIPDRLLAQANVSDAATLLAGIQPTAMPNKGAATFVSVSDFRVWFASQLQDGFNIVATPVTASDAVRLSALIDQDSDGMVTAAEVQSAAQQLKFRDLDDDQTFTAAELLPFRDPRNQQAALVPEVANLPMIQVTDKASADRAAKQIMARYGQKDALELQRLRLPEAVTIDSLNETKTTANGLSEKSLSDWLLAETLSADQTLLHLNLMIRLSDRASASRLNVEASQTAQLFCKTELFRKDSRCRLLIDEMPIEIRSRGGSKDSRGFMVNFLLQRMTSYDEDKDQSLSEDEFPPLQMELSSQLQVTGSFQDLDLNSDGMLLRGEVKGFIERDSLATQSRIEVSVRQDGRTLFKLLDTNGDRRLSPRELLSGFDALEEFDFDKDEQVSESELGTSYILTIGLGQAEALRRNPMMQSGGMASTDAVLPGVDGLSGPEWFRRMDRNQDGDVAWREFLGERKLFDQFDTDANQLIDAAEAEAEVK
ncbi:MAG: hypothetical protein ABJZ55_24995 [Fuerstiella sp.]